MELQLVEMPIFSASIAALLQKRNYVYAICLYRFSGTFTLYSFIMFK